MRHGLAGSRAENLTHDFLRIHTQCMQGCLINTIGLRTLAVAVTRRALSPSILVIGCWVVSFLVRIHPKIYAVSGERSKTQLLKKEKKEKKEKLPCD